MIYSTFGSFFDDFLGANFPSLWKTNPDGSGVLISREQQLVKETYPS